MRKQGFDWSIGQRLALGFGVLLLGLATLGGAVYRWQAESLAAQRDFTQRIEPLTDAATALDRALLRVALRLRSYLLTPSDARLRQYDAAVETARGALQTLAGLPKDADGAAAFRRVEPRVLRYLAAVDDVAGEARRGRLEAADEIALRNLREHAESALATLSSLQEAKQAAALDAMEAAREKVMRGVGVTAGAGSIFFLLLAVLTVQAVRRPAREVVTVADAMRRGDWSPALAWATSNDGNGNGNGAPRDELRRVAEAVATAAVALEQREQRLRADRRVASAAASSLSSEAVAAAALQVVGDHLGAEVGVVYAAEDGSGLLAPIARRALNGEARPLHPGEGIPGRALVERRPVIVRDIPADSAFAVRLGYDTAPPRTVAAVPLAVRDEVLGVLVVASLHDLEPPALEFLEATGAQLGIGLQNVRSYERIRQLLGELRDANEQIQAQNEELQAQNEELQAQNEEIQAQSEEIQAQNEELLTQGDEIQSQNEELRRHQERLAAVARELTASDARKNEFLAFLAHELRNPLAAISTGLQVLAHPAVTAERGAHAQEVLARQTRQLSRLIDDLLDVTRISRGKVALQRAPIDLVALLRECIADGQAPAREAGLVLASDLSATCAVVDGDAARLRQVIGNLLDNAIKFSEAGGRVTVALRLDDAGWAEVRVTDTGVGIDPEAREMLFEPFAQGRPHSQRANNGLGLGLALVRALVELHGGSVDAQSDGARHGATFLVRLPLHDGPGRAEGTDAAPAAAGRRRRILIVEDNEDAAHTLRDLLLADGHDVAVAYTAAGGLAAARLEPPELLFCDLGLPDADGCEVARAVRADERLASIRLVALSGYAAEGDRRRAAEAGFDHHLAKPSQVEQLRRILAAGGAAAPAAAAELRATGSPTRER